MGSYLVRISGQKIEAIPLPSGNQTYACLCATRYYLLKRVTGCSLNEWGVARLCVDADIPLDAVKYVVASLYEEQENAAINATSIPRRKRLKRGATYDGPDGVLIYHGKGNFSSRTSWIREPTRESVRIIRAAKGSMEGGPRIV